MSDMSFKDEVKVLIHLRKMHTIVRNTNPALKIQTFWRMYTCRRDHRKHLWLRKHCAMFLSAHYKRQITYMKFREFMFGKRMRAATMVQKYMRGYRIENIQGWGKKLAYARMKRCTNILAIEMNYVKISA
jgi:hypothetical protein